MGALVVTSEFRHQTITPSLLQVPQRAKLVAAKAAAAVLVGLALGVGCCAVVLPVGTVSGAFQLQLVNGDIALRVMGHILTFPVYALLGAGIGALGTSTSRWRWSQPAKNARTGGATAAASTAWPGASIVRLATCGSAVATASAAAVKNSTGSAGMYGSEVDRVSTIVS